MVKSTRLLFAITIALASAQQYSVRKFNLSSMVYSIAVSGNYNLFAGGSASFVRQWRLNDTQYLLDYNSVYQPIAANGSHVYVFGLNSDIEIYKIGTKLSIGRISTPTISIAWAIACTGDYLFTGHVDGSVYRWIITPKTVQKLGDHPSSVQALVINNSSVFSVSDEGTIMQWAVDTGSLERVLKDQNLTYYSIASVGDYLFAAGSFPFYIKKWRISTGVLLDSLLTGHTFDIYCLVVNGNFLFSGADDYLIKQWDISSGSFIRDLAGHTDTIWQLAAYGPFVFSGSSDGLVIQWAVPELIISSPTLPVTSDIPQTKLSIKSSETKATETIQFSSIKSSIEQISTSTTDLSKTISTNTAQSKTLIITSIDVINNNNNNNNMPQSIIVYLAIGYGSLVLLIATGFLIYKSKRLTSRLVVKQSAGSLNPMIISMQATRLKSDYTGIEQLKKQMITNNKSSSAKVSFDSYSGIRTNANVGEISPVISMTQTLYSSKRQGLYVPGHYLFNSGNLIYKPIRVIYANSNCDVQHAQALDYELSNRSRNGVIAVKILRKLNRFFVDNFYQEISIMYYFVGRPNFVQLIGFSNAPYQIITDYYALGNLEQALLRRTSIFPSKNVAFCLSLQISKALMVMHENGFAHSDIKALNIFLDRDSAGRLQCYLGDFGLSQVLDDSHLIVNAYRVFNMKGLTVPYASPELIRRFRKNIGEGEAVHGWSAGDFYRADVYALGILLFEIFQGIYAWEWKTPEYS